MEGRCRPGRLKVAFLKKRLVEGTIPPEPMLKMGAFFYLTTLPWHFSPP